VPEEEEADYDVVDEKKSAFVDDDDGHGTNQQENCPASAVGDTSSDDSPWHVPSFVVKGKIIKERKMKRNIIMLEKEEEEKSEKKKKSRKRDDEEAGEAVRSEAPADLFDRPEPLDLFAGPEGAALLSQFLAWKPKVTSHSPPRAVSHAKPAAFERRTDDGLVSSRARAEPPGSSARAAPQGSRSPKASISFWDQQRPMVAADGARWRQHSRIECAILAENVQKRVEGCEEAYEKVFDALAEGDGRISFRLPSPGAGVRQELAHAKAILARLSCCEVPFYVGITQMPSRRWHGLYLDASSTPVHHSRKGEPGIREEYLGHKEKWELMEIMHVTDSAEANALFEINLIQDLQRNPFCTNTGLLGGGRSPAEGMMSPPYFCYVCYDNDLRLDPVCRGSG
jgi:hypothetical protein